MFSWLHIPKTPILALTRLWHPAYGSHVLNYIFISVNSLSVPLGPRVLVREFCRALGRESCSHRVPTYCALVCVMGAPHKPG